MTNLFNLAEQNNIEVHYAELPQCISVAFSVADSQHIGMDYSLISSPELEKTCLAHEIGHCVTGSLYDIGSPYEVRAKNEYKANKWAVHYLIPFEDLKRAILSGYTETWEISDYLNVPQSLVEEAEEIYRKEGKL